MKKKIEILENLMNIITSEKLTELNYEEKGLKIALKRPYVIPNKKIDNSLNNKVNKIINAEQLEEIKILSEGIGHFHSLSKSGTLDFKIGDSISEGDKIGYIFAMGLKTPIVSKYTGFIEEIYIEEGDVVDFNRPILKLKK